MINYAKSLGDCLLVAIDTDRRVKELKGPSRPINDQWNRLFMLENLKSVDLVCLFDSEEELINIIRSYNPDIMVKGDDYKNRPVVGEEHLPKIEYYDRTEHSTTKIIQDITNR
jgi:bifunctional ADP-heptose synthase (sugar kinase/adenylyltransferase)